MQPYRQAGAYEVVVGVVVEAGAGADVPLDVVVDEERKTAIEIVFGLGGVGAVWEEGVPLGVGAPAIAERVGHRPRLGPLGVGVGGGFVEGAVELRAAGGRDKVIDSPAVNPVEAGQEFVGAEIAGAGWDGRLRDECHLRQQAFLRGESDFEAEIKVGRPAVFDAVDFLRVDVLRDAKLQPIGEDADAKQGLGVGVVDRLVGAVIIKRVGVADFELRDAEADG